MASIISVFMIVLLIFVVGFALSSTNFQTSQNIDEITGGAIPTSKAKTCVSGTVTAKYGVTYGSYKIYSDIATSSSYARILIKDRSGKTVDTFIINQGSSYFSSATGLAIKVSRIAALPDGTVVGVDLSVTSFVSGTATAKYGITYGNYKIYSDMGVNSVMAEVLIKNKAGKTIDTLLINQGDSKDSPASGLTVKVINVMALPDGTIVGVDLSVKSTC